MTDRGCFTLGTDDRGDPIDVHSAEFYDGEGVCEWCGAQRDQDDAA